MAIHKDIHWHTLTVDEAAKRLGTDPKSGLSPEEARKRLEAHGPNVLVEKKRRTALDIFAAQFKDFMIIVLVAAAIVSGILGEAADTVAIVVIVVLNAVVGFVQEYRAERAMEALKKMAAPFAVAVRGGAEERVPTTKLVPGDLVILDTGQVVPAELRLVEVHKLKVEEAALTGESVPVEKSISPIRDRDAATGDRRDMAFKGTVVSYGRGTGLVVATGMDTELGRIAELIQEDGDSMTPLQKRLALFGRRLSLAVLAICAIVFAAGLLRGEPVALMFLTAVSLAVAAIPEALPAVVTVSLALGANKMVRKNVLIRKLPAVETLGSVTYICADKTGTITQNKMTVKEYFFAGELSSVPPASPSGPAGMLLMAMALNNDAKREKGGSLTGDPTEAALYAAGEKAGFIKEAFEVRYPRVAEVPFDSERKLMSTVHRDPEGGFLMITKGALEQVVGSSVNALGVTSDASLDREALTKAGEKSAAEGFRVLAYGFRRLDAIPEDVRPEHEMGLTFIGFVGLLDPPREEVREAVAECRSAGINVVMITGDHPATAMKIADEVGIDAKSSKTILGPVLKKLPLKELERRVEGARVYARVAPEQKFKIVEALKDRGQFVAMTGDGVNDAPALKKADIGVAMGITGSDVAKEASDMVLLDDNFASIVRAVREGRRIYDNIRKFIKYAMTGNSGEIWTLFLAPLLGLPLPLLPIQILWINLVTDGLPGLALAVEPGEKGIMARPPRHPEESVFAHGLGSHIMWVGLLMGAVSITAQAWFYAEGGTHWQSMVFTVLCLSQMGHVMAIRSETDSLFSQGLFSNLPLVLSVILTFGLQMSILYVPFFNPIFKTQPLTAYELAVTIGLSMVVFVAVEIEKVVKRKRVANRRATSGYA